MKIIILFLVLSLSLSSCSHYYTHYDQTDRSPSSTNTLTVDDVLTFKKSAKKDGKELSSIQSTIKSTLSYYKIDTQFIKSTDLPSDAAFRVEFDVVDGKYVIRVKHSADAFAHHQAVVALNGFFGNFANATHLIHTPYAYFEMYYNAKEKDIFAIDDFLKLRLVPTVTGVGGLSKDEGQLVEDAKVEVNEMREQIAAEVKKAQKARKEAKVSRKEIIEALDKASDDKQFKTLVAKNDRKGVVALLKKYLPYEDMAPFEKRYWDNYLDIIQNPVPHEERIFVYRGIDDDFIHLAIDGGEEIEKDTAIKEGKVFLMSTVLVKNQGSWNRRLRSLESMEEKFIGTVNGNSEYAGSARISIMFKNHSMDPKGSPFLSFTPNVNVASQFGHSRNSAYLIDPRVLQFNFTSGFENEKEFLAGLITFPDEMVGVWTSANNSGETPEKFLKDKLAQLVETKYGKADKDKILKEIEKNTYDFFSPVFKIGGSNKAPQSTYLGSIASFFKKFLGGKPAPTPSVTASGDLTCDDIIKAFWVK
jgi:hypothetical protein